MDQGIATNQERERERERANDFLKPSTCSQEDKNSSRTRHREGGHMPRKQNEITVLSPIGKDHSGSGTC